MTCEQFHEIVLNKSLTEATRAERIAVFHHADSCQSCCNWLHDGVSEGRDVEPEHRLSEEQMIRLLRGDTKDPEFYS